MDSSIFMQPCGVQGQKPGAPVISAPALATWKPSTSLAGEMVSMTFWLSICLGSGSCTRMPCTFGFSLSARMRASRSASLMSAG
jgi:hypothetical protein